MNGGYRFLHHILFSLYFHRQGQTKTRRTNYTVNNKNTSLTLLLRDLEEERVLFGVDSSITSPKLISESGVISPMRVYNDVFMNDKFSSHRSE